MGLLGAPSRKQYNWQEERLGPTLKDERKDILFATLTVSAPEPTTTHTIISVPSTKRASLISFYIEESDADFTVASLILDGVTIKRYNSDIVGTSFYDSAEYKYEECPRFSNSLQYRNETAVSAGPSIVVIIGYILEPFGEGYFTGNN